MDAWQEIDEVSTDRIFEKTLRFHKVTSILVEGGESGKTTKNVEMY